jgi:ADP-ribose pyrophosphatase YjhB (NUDIX family)
VGWASKHAERDGRLPYWRYRLILGQVPIACVDILLVRTDVTPYQVGLIKRFDENQEMRWAMVGGAIHRGETVTEAVRRHVRDTLGPRATIELATGEGRPQALGQYFPTPRPGYGHDPRKHAIAVSYWGRFAGQAVAMGEAEAVGWFEVDDVPALTEFGYGHGEVVATILEAIGRPPGQANGSDGSDCDDRSRLPDS